MSRFIWFVVLTTLLVRCGGSEGSCLEPLEPDDDPKVMGKKCTGHVVAEHLALSELHCADFCFRHPSCRHYNFRFSVVRKRHRKVCELFAETDGKKNKPHFLCREFPRQDNILMPNATTECFPGRA